MPADLRRSVDDDVARCDLALLSIPRASIAGGPVLGDIPLVDQTGAPFYLRDLLRRPAAITFVATRCQDTCRIVNAVFARLSRDKLRARLVTISLDPDYDTPSAGVSSPAARQILPASWPRSASWSPRAPTVSPMPIATLSMYSTNEDA